MTIHDSSGADPSWSEFQRRRRAFFTVLASAVPAAGAAWFLSSPAGWAVVAGAWLLAITVSSLRLEGWPCPRCGKPFLRKGAWHNSFATRCLNCELPMSSLTGPRDGASTADHPHV